MIDGSGPVRGHHSLLKRGMGVRVFERRRNQSPKTGAIPPRELQTQIHNHATADHVPKGRCYRRVNRSLPKGILGIDAAQENPSGTTMPLSQMQHPSQNSAQHVTKLAR